MVSRSFAERTAFQALAEELKEQLFGKRKVLVEIRERFQLGGDFTPEQLFCAYRESLLAELKSRSLIAARILENGAVRFPSPEVLCCEVEDMPLNRRVLPDLKRYLEEEVFLGRCGIPMEFRADYVPYERKKLEEVPAEALTVRSREESEEEGFFLAGEEGTDSTEANEAQPTEHQKPSEEKAKAEKSKTEKAAKQAKHADQKGNYRGEKREFTRKLRRSDNPDVLYGRDFEDNFIPISEITEVVGEVTIRGKVFELDVRYIEKSGSTLFIFSVTDFTDSITAKLFVRGEGEELDRLKSEIKVGAFLKLRGATTIDNRDGELILGSVNGMKKSESFEESKREDTRGKSGWNSTATQR